MIEKKDWWKILATCVLTMVCTIMVQNIVFSHNDKQLEFKENKDDHIEIVRGCMSYVENVKLDCKAYTDAKYDSILLLLREVKDSQERQKNEIAAIHSYILNRR